MKKNKLPVLFQTLRNFDLEDTRFSKVKIWLMHLEDNMNGSYFTKDVVERALPSLANIPILGLINKEQKDFEGHAISLSEDMSGDVKLQYLTVPYGVIPEMNNAQFEDRVGDDGVTRTYLTVEGLLWNRWEDSINILNSKEGLTGQSMEITDFAGTNREDGLINVDYFKFDGACMLGESVTPAMTNSTVELAFSNTKSVGEIIEEKLAIYAKSNTEGGNTVSKENEEKEQEVFEDNPEETPVEDDKEQETQPDETPEEPVAPEEPTEPEVEPEPETPEVPEEEPEEPEVEPEQEEPAPEPEPTEPEESETPEESEVEDEAEEGVIIKESTIGKARSKVIEHDEQIVPAIDRITIGENVYSVEELVEIAKEHFTLVQELHKEKVDSLFAEHAEALSEEEIDELKKDAYTKELVDTENAIFAVIGRKAFTKKSNKTDSTNVFTSTKITTKSSNSKEPYGGILNK